MRTDSNAVARVLVSLAAVLFLAAFAPSTLAGDLKLEAQLIWGTNEPKSPDSKLKPVEPAVEKKLKCLPFKWDRFFEVNRQQFTVAENTTNKVAMSKDCILTVKNLGDSKVEVCLVGKGERTCKINRALPKGELLVTGGNAPNTNGWFVVLKQVD